MSQPSLSDAVSVTIDDLRAAVLAVRTTSVTHETAETFADSIEAALDGLRRVVDLNQPLVCRIAGLFYALGDPPTVTLSSGDRLILRRAPDNPADANAVAVHTTSGTRCGYLPRGAAADLAPHLDAGLTAEAAVAEAWSSEVRLQITGPAVVAMNGEVGVYYAR